MATDAVLSVHSALAAVALSSAPVDAGPVESQSFCVTTAINYANGLPHMGHAYEAISADVLARYHRAYGRRVLFMTGSDEHGQKIAETAALRGVSPLALCNEYVSKFQARLHLPLPPTPTDACVAAGAERAVDDQLRRLQPDDVAEAPRLLPAHFQQVAAGGRHIPGKLRRLVRRLAGRDAPQLISLSAGTTCARKLS